MASTEGARRAFPLNLSGKRTEWENTAIASGNAVYVLLLSWVPLRRLPAPFFQAASLAGKREGETCC